MGQISATLPSLRAVPCPVCYGRQFITSKIAKVSPRIRDTGCPEKLVLNSRINHDTKIPYPKPPRWEGRRISHRRVWPQQDCQETMSTCMLEVWSQVIPAKLYLLLVKKPTTYKQNKTRQSIALYTHGLLPPQYHDLEIIPIQTAEAIEEKSPA